MHFDQIMYDIHDIRAFPFDREGKQKGIEYLKDFLLEEPELGWLHLVCVALEISTV